jgi:hypothetical protein
MKKLNIFKTVFALFLIALMCGGAFCVKEKPCERDNTGTVRVINNFPGVITVDVWSDFLPGDGFMGERTLGIGMSATYNNVPAGSIEIWETDAYTDWGYWDEYCSQCQTLEFTITEYKKGETIIEYGIPLYIENKLKSEKK